MGGVLHIGPDFSSTTKTSSYILTASDIGTLVQTDATVTVDQNIFTAGNATTIYNNSASNIAINQGTGVTFYLAGTATTGNRTLAQRGVATVLCVASNAFVVSGSGLT